MKKIRFNAMLMYLAWFATAVFYFYQYILRVAPNVTAKDLKIEFGITADQFASLGSLYLLAYSLLQIPLGIITDRIGVRKMVLISTIFCISGGLIFSYTENFTLIQISRILIGAGSASALMCALKQIADCFPSGKRALLMGFTLTMGTGGALFAGEFIQNMTMQFGWREASFFSALLGFITLILSFFLIPKSNEIIEMLKVYNQYEYSIYSKLLAIISHRPIMIYSIIAIGLYSPLATFGDLWGSSFLSQKFSLEQVEASSISLLLYLGLSIGSILMPWLAEKYNKMNFVIVFCIFGVLISLLLIVYGPVFDIITLKIMMIMIGIFSGAEMICFTAALQYSKITNSGEIIGVVNTMNMLGSAILQQAVGTILDQRWNGTFVDNMPYYSSEDFIVAVLPITIVISICTIIALSLFCQKKYKYDELNR